ncbi:MAG: B12-binding domain-containing radical SAM protein [Desulfobacterales bacterium]|nr:B12-binding domain-containing radical SAM protein [Desulfobacterales bacterium]
MIRLLLINPLNKHRHLGNMQSTEFPPLNLPYLAAVTPQHYQIEVIDENIEPFETREADIVGITAYTASVNRAYQIAQIYRKKGVPTVMGGIHASMMPEEALDYCDTVVVGEAEAVWPRVLEDFESNRMQKLYKGLRPDLDTLPIPRHDVLQNKYYRWGSIQTSRGCPMNCSFCSVTAFNGRQFRRRPLDSVIEDLKQIPQKWIFMIDDNIIGYGRRDLEWTHAFFSRILQEGIKKKLFAQASILFGEDRELVRLAARAGLTVLFTGIESVNQETLKSYRKNINLDRLRQDRYKELISRVRKAGILFLGAFVLGSDSDDRSIFHSTLEFVNSSHIDILQASKLTPLPGTQLWKTLQEEGRISGLNFPKAWDKFRFSRLLFEPKLLSIEEVDKGCIYLRKMYYGFWQTVKRTLFTLIATKSLTSTIGAYKINASYQKAFRESEHYRLYNSSDLKKEFGP